MKNRPNEKISSSDDSNSEAENPPISKSSTTVNNSHSKEFVSDSSSSELERSFRQNNAQQKVKTKATKKIGGNIVKEFAATIPGTVRLESRVVIDEDDKISFLEVPKFLDTEQFLGKLINFDKKIKVKINKAKYVIEPTDASTKPLTLLTRKLQIIHPLTTLQLREHVKHKNNTIEIQAEKFKPSLPENLKTRHPLFGAEYKYKIVLSEEIEQKLDNTIEHFVKKMKKKRKHREKKSEVEERTNIKQEETCENGEAIFTLLETHSPGKKKKKKANKEVEDQEDDTQIRKNNIMSSTVIADLQLPSFEFDVSGIGHENEQTPTKSKKKKKEKSFDESESEKESGSRKRKLSCLSSQSETDDIKKEKKRGSEDFSSKKKLHKKIKKEKTETDSLITDLLSQVKSEMDDTEKIKKNKSHHHSY